MTKKMLCTILFCACFLVHTISAQTSIKKENDAWVLLVDENPFEVKGVTFGYENDVANYDKHFKDLNFLGVNTIRTWGSGKNTKKLLDAAHKHQIKVMLGIWMRHGRPGMEADDSFDYLENEKGKQELYDEAIKVVETYKNHPAILTWGVGNEVYLNMATDPEKKVYSKLLETICKKIKELDKNHLITSVEAWTFGLDWWQKYVPSIDIYGLNSYGAGAGFLTSELEKRKIDKPYIITEFGVTGEWDIKQEKNGVKKEPSDAQKYDAIAKGYANWIQSKPNCLGVYVFSFADGKNFIAPWLFTHYQGNYRPQYWAIREAFTEKKPINNVPEIQEFTLPEGSFKSETWVPVSLKVSDIENEALRFSFFYNQRTGSRKRRDQLNKLNFRGNYTNGFQVKLPKEHGGIKVYVTVKDTYNNVGIASNSILIEDEIAKHKKFLVAKATLPFYVYKDGEKNPFSPTAYMGNYKDIEVDLQHTEGVHFGKASLRIRYKEVYNWYGLGFVDPPNNWGDKLGGFDISGATTFSFWAKASKKKVKVTIGFGLIGKDKPFPDSSKKAIEIKLSTKWKKYTIKTEKLDLSYIRSGLVLFSSADGTAQDIFLDDVVFE
jgi:rRNA maturation protein Rpf1